jgi:hypothetical protein
MVSIKKNISMRFIIKKIQQISVVLGILLSVFTAAQAQTDSLSLLDDAPEKLALLPEKMTLIQRGLWGEKGLFRTTGIAPLTEAVRTKEMKVRRAMLVTHQVVGFATLAGMVAQGIVGAKLYKGSYDAKDLHEVLGVAVNTGYFTTAGMALFLPPPLISRKQGINSIKIHKALAYLHFSGMILTNVLADKASNPTWKPVHRAAAFTAFGAYAAAVVSIKF